MRLLCLDEGAARAVRAAQPSERRVREAAQRMAALSDPNRLRVALVLNEVGELCVGDTATLLELPIALVSHHMRALAARGLAEKRRDGKLIRYRLTPDGQQLLAVAFAAPRAAVARAGA